MSARSSLVCVLSLSLWAGCRSDGLTTTAPVVDSGSPVVAADMSLGPTGTCSHNSCVTTEQNFLNTYRSTWHGSKLSTDGQYGHLTITQVRKFQSYARISVDGLVGPQTWGSEIGFIQCPHGC